MRHLADASFEIFRSTLADVACVGCRVVLGRLGFVVPDCESLRLVESMFNKKTTPAEWSAYLAGRKSVVCLLPAKNRLDTQQPHENMGDDEEGLWRDKGDGDRRRPLPSVINLAGNCLDLSE